MAAVRSAASYRLSAGVLLAARKICCGSGAAAKRSPSSAATGGRDCHFRISPLLGFRAWRSNRPQAPAPEPWKSGVLWILSRSHCLAVACHGALGSDDSTRGRGAEFSFIPARLRSQQLRLESRSVGRVQLVNPYLIF